MERIQRDFSKRADWERTYLTENTWCDVCLAADTGIINAIEYEENGDRYIEGRCARCGTILQNPVIEPPPASSAR
jgi:hypothetical protein